jgi:hypothetical protein
LKSFYAFENKIGDFLKEGILIRGFRVRFFATKAGKYKEKFRSSHPFRAPFYPLGFAPGSFQ